MKKYRHGEPIPVKMFNEQQEANWQEYCKECRDNGVQPQKRDNFNQFMTVNVKHGYVMDGKYWQWKRRKSDFYY